MIPYHKIQTVYLRDPETKFKTLLEGQFATDAIAYLADREWLWTEKIDGTNIRVHFDGEKIRYGGRTDRAQIPAALFTELQETFEGNTALRDIGPCTLYGEGYGEKIQSGGHYIVGGCGFILFDVLIGDLWLKREDVLDVGSKLGVNVVSEVGHGTLAEAVEFARQGFRSCAAEKERPAEGLVMRPSVDLFDRRGDRVIAKIKAKDFPKEER